MSLGGGGGVDAVGSGRVGVAHPGRLVMVSLGGGVGTIMVVYVLAK